MKNPQFYQNLNRARRGFQIVSLLFLIAVPVLNWLGVHWILGTLYSLSIGAIDITDPAMALQTVLLTKQIYLNHWRKSHLRLIAENPHPVWYWSIFAALVLLTFMLDFPLLSFLSTPGLISSAISQSILGMGFGIEVVLVVILIALELVIARRFWCKYLCPVGATLALFRVKGTWRLQHEAALCACPNRVEPCHTVCPLQLSPKQANVYPYCFNCGLCVAVCEKIDKGALSLHFLRPNLSKKIPRG